MDTKFSGCLEEEFATVILIANSDCRTRGLDSLLLAWTKYEKQLRKLFCFLVYQHPDIGTSEIGDVVEALAQNRWLYPRTFIAAVEALGVGSIQSLIGTDYEELATQLERIQKYRNKLVHGQVTGLGLATEDLLEDVNHIAAWMTALASGAQRKFGYDGLRRDSFVQAKGTDIIAVAKYPFASASEFKAWLTEVSKPK